MKIFLLTLWILICLALMGYQIYLLVIIPENQRKQKMINYNKKISSIYPKEKEECSKFNLSMLFDKIYVISIPDRKDYILETLKTFRIEPEIISATLKQNLDLSAMSDGIAKIYYKVPHNLGRIACHLSHMRALQTFLDSPAETAVIFEDDLKPCHSYPIFKRRMCSLKKEFRKVKNPWILSPSKADILYLGHCWTSCKKMTPLTQQIYGNFEGACRHAYAVNRKAAELILTHTLPMYDNGDMMLKRMSHRGILNTYAIMPPLFFQNRGELGSTIGNDHDLYTCCDMNFAPQRISVIISNVTPEDGSLRKNVAKLKQHPLIDEIIVAHGKEENSFECPKVKNVKNFYFYNIYGELHRYFVVDEASYDFILFVDGNKIPSKQTITEMKNEMILDPLHIYFDEKSKSFITHKSIIESFLKYLDKMDPTQKKNENTLKIVEEHLKKQYGKVPKIFTS